MARRDAGSRRAWLAVALAFSAVAVWAQDARPEAARDATLGSLPQSNEALLLSSRAEQAMRLGDYRLAIELLERIRTLEGELVAAPASRTFYPVWRQAHLLSAQMPADGVELYRQLMDGEVETRFRAAAAKADVGALAVLFRNHRLSLHWTAIGDELAALLIDRGRFGEAVETLNELRSAGADETAARIARRLVALRMMAAGGAADQALRDLRDVLGPTPGDGWAARLARLEAWEPAGAAPRRPAAYALDAGAAWTSLMDAAGQSDAHEQERRLGQAIAALQHLPLHEPAVCGDALLVRANGRIHAFDALTLAPRWAVREIESAANRALGAGLLPPSPAELFVDSAARLLLSNHLRHVFAADAERVYTVEGLALLDASDDMMQRPFAAANPSVYANELAARSLATGDLLWRTGEDPGGELADAEFLDRPLVIGGRLLAAVRRGEEQHLVELEAESGALVRSVKVVGPPAHFTRAGGRSLLTRDATTVYMSTGIGVIAALRLDDLSWKWAASYPSTVSEHIGRLWWKPAVAPSESGVDRMFVADDLLIAAPIDSLDIFAIDRFTGRERWRMPRADAMFVAGALAGGLITGSNAVVCHDLADPLGKPLRWRSVPLEITGRPVVHGARVFVPCSSGLAVLDGATGKLLAEQGEPRSDGQSPAAGRVSIGGAGANLVLTDEACYRVSPVRVTKFPDLERTQAAAVAAGGGGRGELALAWVDVLSGAHEAALAKLDALGPAEAATPAVSRLRMLVFDALAAQARGPEERLDWLRRAAGSATTPEEQARLDLRVGAALEELERWDEAVRFYAQTLGTLDGADLAVEGQGGARRAAWLAAVERLRGLATHPPAAAALAELVERWRGEGEAGLVGLQRLRMALPAGETRAAAARAIVMSRLPPELSWPALDDAALDSRLPLDERRRLQLSRWEICVALDELAAAAEEERAWDETFGGRDDDGAAAGVPTADGVATGATDPGATAGAAAEEADRLEAIRLSQRKLLAGRAEPFGAALHRQWRIRHGELALARDWFAEAGRRWLLINDLELNELQLVNAERYQNPQRRFAATLRGGESGLLTDMQAIFGDPSLVWNQAVRAYWPVAAHGHLAAFPVRGGLVAAGLGPERNGGRRLWEFRVPEWTSAPENFAALSVAGPLGVYVSPRPERVQLVGWADGAVWWVTDVAGAAIDRLRLAGDRLVAVTTDQRVLVFDARLGGGPQVLETSGMSALGVELIEDRIVVWGRQAAVGFDVRTLERRWVRELTGSSDAVPVAGRGWLAIRAGDGDRWTVLDARDGQSVFEAFGPLVELDALAVVGERLYSAGREPSLDEDDVSSAALVRCTRLDGTLEWEARRRSRTPVNVSQLVGHPDWIPVYIEAWRAEGGDADGGPALQLIRRSDGAAQTPLGISGDYKAERGVCAVNLFVTPTRVVVQVDGNTLGYGTAGGAGEE